MRLKAINFISKYQKIITTRKLFLIITGSILCTFGIYNIHNRTSITEGGIIGLTLLIENWLHISLAYVTPLLDIVCYLMAFKYLGEQFIVLSLIASFFTSLFYKIWEHFPYMLPDLSLNPLLSAILGGLFVGVGVGLIVRCGGSCGGDDALALTISKAFNWRLSLAYLFSDVTALILSLSYIPLSHIVYSLITVTISSNLIDFIKEI